MSKLIQEFKEFAVKGNAVDMAVGVIIGGAFGKIVSSIVDDIIMPPIGWLIGGVNFSDLKYTLPQVEIKHCFKTMSLALYSVYKVLLSNFLHDKKELFS